MRTHLAALIPVTALALAAGLAGAEPDPLAAGLSLPPEGTRGPFEIHFTQDGSRALVTEFDENSLAVLEIPSGRVLRRFATGGEEPTGVSATPDGRLAVVTNSFSGSVALIDLDGGPTRTVPLPGMPYDVVVSPDGTLAYVSVSQLDQVAVLDLARAEVVARIPTGRRPRALDLSPDGRTLVAANLTEGSVSFLDTQARRELGRGPTTAVNLRGVALLRDPRTVYCVGQRAQNERPTETPVGIWSNQGFVTRIGGPRTGLQNLWLDYTGRDVSDPESVVLDPEGRRAFTTFSGGHSVNVQSLTGTENQPIQRVGLHPKGLAFTRDGKEVWVANHLGNDIAVIDPEALRVVRRIPLGPPGRKDPHLRGRFLFTTATITQGGQFSCNSCHPDGGTDGISWKFVHVPDALGKETDRNVRSLRGGLADTTPFRWSGHDRTLEQFIREELSGLFRGPDLPADEVASLVGYLESLRLPPNPHRNPDGSFTEAALRGRALFAGKAGCADCHTGPKAGGQRKAWVGTTPAGLDLDVPHLAGVYDSDPYLHHGKARTLEEIFTRHDPEGKHGNMGALTAEERKDLLDYVRQL